MSGWKGISEGVLREADVTTDHRGNQRVPYCRYDGTFFRDRIYPPTGRGWWGEGDGLIPYGLETLPGPYVASKCAVMVCEGESDALAVREVFRDRYSPPFAAGWYDVALPGASVWLEQWAQWIEPFGYVFLLGDGDEAGRSMNERVRADVPKALTVMIPDGEDARAMLQRDAGSLDPLLLAALVDAADIATISQALGIGP